MASLLHYKTLRLFRWLHRWFSSGGAKPVANRPSGRRTANRLCFAVWAGCAINVGPRTEDAPAGICIWIIGQNRKLASEVAWGGSRFTRSAGAGHELLPALLDASRGAKLQAKLPGLRLLYVLLGFLLRREHARPRRGKRFSRGKQTTSNCELFRRRERGTANDGSGSGWSKRAGY